MRRTLTYGALLLGLCVTLAVVTLSLSGCNTARVLNIENPSYSIRDLRPHLRIALPLQESSIDFDFLVTVDNPNSVSLNLARLDFGVLVNGDRLIDSVSNERINIPAHGVNDVRLRARVGYRQIPNLWQQIVDAVHGERASYEVQGNAYFDTPLGQMRFPVSIAATR